MKRSKVSVRMHLDWAYRRNRGWFDWPPTVLNVAEALGIKPCDVVEVFPVPERPGRSLLGFDGTRMRALPGGRR